MIYQTNPIVAMDHNHIELIGSLIKCNKPKTVLEIGIGSGLVTKTIIDSFSFNEMEIRLTCVDNFIDWNGNTPLGFETYMDIINFISKDERTFIHECNSTYDFIISDADHHHTNEWIDKTLNILNPGGILIYHDVTNKDFVNLYSIINYVQQHKLNHFLFNKNSKPTERCDRGLLIINK
jgi:predicted O-methyltransferase YrrM